MKIKLRRVPKLKSGKCPKGATSKRRGKTRRTMCFIRGKKR